MVGHGRLLMVDHGQLWMLWTTGSQRTFIAAIEYHRSDNGLRQKRPKPLR
jgi:hypothetical protein